MGTATPAFDAPDIGSESVRNFGELSRDDVSWAGGKGANLGELTRAGFPVPEGFVVGAPAYAAACDASGARHALEAVLRDLDVDDPAAVAAAADEARAILDHAAMPEPVEAAIRAAYAALGDDVPVAVRSSATAEDTAALSFAGMHASILNVRGADAVVAAVRGCWRSLFGARAIAYRMRQGLDQTDMDIAVVVQRQVASRASGVLFTADPATGDPELLTVEASVGLGETVVAGEVSPDRFVVDKADGRILRRDVRHKTVAVEPLPGGGTERRVLEGSEASGVSLVDGTVLALTTLGREVEAHYGAPQDIEWALDDDGRLWLVQSRPITAFGTPAAQPRGAGAPVVRGLGAAPGRATGVVRVITGPQAGAELQVGEVLVAPMTTPDWLPVLRRAVALITDSGGITCHAAIVARELGVPAIVGAGDATRKLHDGDLVTVDGTHGVVTAAAATLPAAPAGALTVIEHAAPRPADWSPPPVTGTRVMLNLSDPGRAADAAALPSDGVGLLRAELMVVEALGGDHPQLLVSEGRTEEAVERMAESIEAFTSAFAPRPVVYRAIDFRSSEFRRLRGGELHEPVEENPMIGLRGALRAIHHPEVLEIELAALTRVWENGGTNVRLMIPFVRSAAEFRVLRNRIAERGLLDRRGFELWIMAEVPSVLFELERYAELGVAGISVGTNDLTQLLLGVDRDSALVADAFDAGGPAVQAYLGALLGRAAALGLGRSLCGQVAATDAAFVQRLVEAGIESVSVSPDALERTRGTVAAAEQRLLLAAARRAEQGGAPE